MQNFLPAFFNGILLSLLLSLLLLAANSCQDTPPTPPDAALDTVLSDLLAAADTLPPEAVFARAAQLPDQYQDSFFAKRLLALEAVDDHARLQTTVEAYQKARPGKPLMLAATHYQQGVMHQFAGRFEAADSCYVIAEKNYTLLGDKDGLIRVLDAHSGCLGTKGRYDEGIAMKYRAIDICNETGQKGRAMEVQAAMATQFNSKGDFDKAIALLEQPLAYFEEKKDSSFMAYAYSIGGTAYLSKKEYQRGLEHYTKALAFGQRSSPPSMISQYFYHCGRALSRLGRWQGALDTLRMAETMILNGPNKQGLAFVKMGLGEALFNLGRHEEAEQYLMFGLETSAQRKQYHSGMMNARMMSAVQKQKNQFADALRYHEQYVTFKDSMFGQEKDKLSRELTVKYETREKEQQIASLQKENALAAQRNWWIGGSLMLLAAFGLFWVRQRARRKQEQLEKTLEIQRIELKSNEALLDDYAQMLLERNTRIEALAEQYDLKNLSHDQAEPPGSDRATEEPLYNQTYLSEQDWGQFQARFNRAYPTFLPEVKQQIPSLTTGETRLLMLAKMGLNTKEAATILGISATSVKQGRYRLRKKLQDAGVAMERLLEE